MDVSASAGASATSEHIWNEDLIVLVPKPYSVLRDATFKYVSLNKTFL